MGAVLNRTRYIPTYSSLMRLFVWYGSPAQQFDVGFVLLMARRVHSSRHALLLLLLLPSKHAHSTAVRAGARDAGEFLSRLPLTPAYPLPLGTHLLRCCVGPNGLTSAWSASITLYHSVGKYKHIFVHYDHSLGIKMKCKGCLYLWT